MKLLSQWGKRTPNQGLFRDSIHPVKTKFGVGQLGNSPSGYSREEVRTVGGHGADERASASHRHRATIHVFLVEHILTSGLIASSTTHGHIATIRRVYEPVLFTSESSIEDLICYL